VAFEEWDEIGELATLFKRNDSKCSSACAGADFSGARVKMAYPQNPN